MTKRNISPTPKELFSEAIRQNIAKKDWQKLSDVLIGAEQIGVSKRLRVKGWRSLAEYQHSRGNLPAAVLAYNSARSLDLGNRVLLSGLLQSYEEFYSEFEDKFSNEDLGLLVRPLNSLFNFYSVHRSQVEPDLEGVRRLAERIRLKALSAPSRRETSATHKVQTIYSAVFSPNMTPEEVRAEFARVFVPLIRDEYEKRMREAKKRKPKGGGGKPPKPPKKKRRKIGEEDEEKGRRKNDK